VQGKLISATDDGKFYNLELQSESTLRFEPYEVVASPPTYKKFRKGFLSAEVSRAKAPMCGSVNVGAEAPTS
jgi:hypothetical protein